MSADRMIVYKSWLDTRWRFIVGLIFLVCSAAGLVFVYPEVIKLLPIAAGVEAPGALGEEIRKAIELSSTFSGYLWLKWNNGNLIQGATLFAILLGAGGVLSQTTGGGAFYTLALPVSRRKLLAVRAGVGLVELFFILLFSSLVIPLVAPAIGETSSVLDQIVHAFCAFIAASLFFSLTLLLATAFSDVWRPLLITVAIAGAIGLAELYFHDALPFGIFRTMSAETYRDTGALPWMGLLGCAAGAAALIYAAILNLERRDF